MYITVEKTLFALGIATSMRSGGFEVENEFSAKSRVKLMFLVFRSQKISFTSVIDVGSGKGNSRLLITCSKLATLANEPKMFLSS